jgi:hypothetical protein
MTARRDDKPSKTPDWLVERLALGELGPEEAAGLRRRLEAEGRSPDEAIAALAASSQEILAAHPVSVVAAAVRRRAAAPHRAPARPLWRGLVLGAPLAGAGLAFALMVVRPTSMPLPATDGVEETAAEQTRMKGTVATGPRLVVYRQGRAGTERLADGARATRGDLVQLATAGGAGAWGMVLSIDGAGRVTLHWPEGGGPAGSLAAAETRLPSAYELDDAPAFERFLLISTDRPFEVGAVLDAARAIAAHPGSARVAPLPIGGRFRQASLTLDKPPGASR